MPTKAGEALIGTFASIRIINLPARSDRRREIAAEFERLGLTIDGRHIAFFEACRPTEAGQFPTIGTRGCFQSHLEVLREAAKSGVENLLIIEDDLDFAPDVEPRLPPTLDKLSSVPWSIFYGGHANYHGEQEGSLLSPADPAHSIQNAHMVGFKKEAIELLVPYLDRMLERKAGHPEGGPMHVDGAYSWFRKAYPSLQTWMAVSEIGHQRPSRTDIHRLGMIDRTPGLRQLAAIGRRVKRKLARASLR